MSGAQFEFVRNALAADPDQPTIVFGHHPVPLDAKLTAIPPVIYGLEQQQATQLEQLYAANPGVFLHHAGHTHRNKRAISTTAPGVVFQEVAAVKEYPGGFHLLRVHTGGYAMNFYKFKDLLAQEWSERSRPEVLGAAAALHVRQQRRPQPRRGPRPVGPEVGGGRPRRRTCAAARRDHPGDGRYIGHAHRRSRGCGRRVGRHLASQKVARPIV